MLKCKNERKVMQKIFTLSYSSQCLFWEKINVSKILYFELWYIHCSLVDLNIIVKFVWEIALMYTNPFCVLFVFFLIWWHLILTLQTKNFVNVVLLVFKYILLFIFFCFSIDTDMNFFDSLSYNLIHKLYREHYMAPFSFFFI